MLATLENQSCSRLSDLVCVPRNTTGGFLNMNPSITDMNNVSQNESGGTTKPTPDKLRLILCSLTFIIILVGMAGNATVLWLLGCRMRRNAFSVYVLNLAGADFLFLCSSFILYFINGFDLFSIYVPNHFLPIWIIFYLAGLGILSAISTERCLSVLCPIWYRCRRPRCLSAFLCALLWALSLVLSLVAGNDCGFLFSSESLEKCRKIRFFTVAWLIFLFLLLSGSNLAVLFRIFCSSRKFQLTRLYVTILLTVLVYLLCGLPYGIYLSLSRLIDSFYCDVPIYCTLILVLLSCVNSCANPIIYFFVGSFRQRRQGQTLKQVLQRALQDTPEEGDSEKSLPQGTLEMSSSGVV
ncbi:mas-related G-protein coupled receptor member X1-like [Ochotona curzoniae]|uniref:mas-related G-protein coupled receptor member X1-like n=1 Tax=Ochotona curzoniae TaxID=130825 RepID=UPI001B349B82|nr:mas-related G-protein coupled receptor member X1-like [Ochotona curzoniae]